MHRNPQKLIDDGFHLTPSLDTVATIMALPNVEGEVEALGVFVASDGPVPEVVGMDRAALVLAGFDASLGSTMKLAGSMDPLVVLVGVGSSEGLQEADGSVWRVAAAAFVRAVPRLSRLAFKDPQFETTEHAAVAAQAMVEGLCSVGTGSVA
ncbi:hypothetical protein G7066_01430 [Leucobacter coleopterorum]|uniref:Leucyl aminopeptidase n=1 Tax=Leucobacter coleopterorum TaxID=2714933 RepID=A0ABX6JTT3_9MICO|nr:hypothetical protein [Leucobacter coleopterorum]QIM17698.1 hypothetical protein G7066_01430 [Leucobacter coleopterorum]